MTDEIFVRKFHKILSDLMKERGVTLAVIAKATGIPKSTLSEWTAGRQPMFDAAIVRLARFFGVSCEYLLTGVEPEDAIVQDFIEQADEGFVTLHRGVYRFKVEKYVGSSKAKKSGDDSK